MKLTGCRGERQKRSHMICTELWKVQESETPGTEVPIQLAI